MKVNSYDHCLDCKRLKSLPNLKFKGNYCSTCSSRRYTKPKIVIKQIVEKKKGNPNYDTENISHADAMLWIEQTIKDKGYTDLNGLNKLIGVFYCIGGSKFGDGMDNHSVKKQFTIMWQACLDYYSKN